MSQPFFKGKAALPGLIAGLILFALTAGPASADLTLYTNAKEGFSLQVPAGWKIDDSGQNGTLATFLCPEIDKISEGKGFRVNMNVVTDDARGSDLEQYADTALLSLSQTFPSYQNLEKRKIVTQSGEPAMLISGTLAPQGCRFYNIQLLVIKDGRAWVITATSLEAAWGAYGPILESSLLSFEKK